LIHANKAFARSCAFILSPRRLPKQFLDELFSVSLNVGNLPDNHFPTSIFGLNFWMRATYKVIVFDLATGQPIHINPSSPAASEPQGPSGRHPKA